MGIVSGEHITVRHGASLPHWTAPNSTYAATFRLADSLPAGVVERWRRERSAAVEEAAARRPLTPRELRKLHAAHGHRIEAYLDAGVGACWLRDRRVALQVCDALLHFDRCRYDLFAWCVMPNHVHVVVRPYQGHSLSEIMHSWKSFTAKAANRILGRSGPFWQAESYDRLLRNEAELERAIAYVIANPRTAGLVDWPFVGAMARLV